MDREDDLMDFLRMTSSQRAGLIGASADDDRALWDELKTSPEVAAIRERRAAEKLAARQRLIAARKAELDRICAEAAALDARRAAATARREKAEREFRAALEAERMLPLYAATGSQLVVDIERELRETAAPEIDSFARWCESEREFARLMSPPFVTDGTGKDGGYDRGVQLSILQRVDALSTAARESHAMKLLAITTDEALDKLRALYARLPPVPQAAGNGLARRPVLPAFLSQNAPRGSA
jgi:hypothetical protein